MSFFIALAWHKVKNTFAAFHHTPFRGHIWQSNSYPVAIPLPQLACSQFQLTGFGAVVRLMMSG
jgi:hypothetical protein